jgi:hypothetical protein
MGATEGMRTFDLILLLIVLLVSYTVGLYYPTIILDGLRGFVVLDVTD